MNECRTCAANLEVLELSAPASAAEIKTAYRDMAKVWHPDRFQNDERLRVKAEERFKKIQRAYEELTTHVAVHSASTTSSGKSSTSSPYESSMTSSAREPNSGRADRILRILAQWADNDKFLVESQIPEEFRKTVFQRFHDVTNRYLGIVDLSSRSGSSFIAFTPKRIAYRPRGWFSVVKLTDYEQLVEILGFKETWREPCFWDKLAVDIGLSTPESFRNLSIRLGDDEMGSSLDNSEKERLIRLLYDVAKAVVS